MPPWFDFYGHLDQLQSAINGLVAQISALQQKVQAMTIQLDALTQQVGANTSVTQSAIQLIQNIAAQLANIPPSTDPTTQAAIDALVATLTQDDTALAAEVTKNTPAAPNP